MVLSEELLLLVQHSPQLTQLSPCGYRAQIHRAAATCGHPAHPSLPHRGIPLLPVLHHQG